MTLKILDLKEVENDPIFGCLKQVLTENVPSYYETTLMDCTFQLLLMKNDVPNCYILTSTTKILDDLKKVPDIENLTFKVTNIYNLFYNVQPNHENVLKLIPTKILNECKATLFITFLNTVTAPNFTAEDLVFNEQTLTFSNVTIELTLHDYLTFKNECNYGLEIETWKNSDGDKAIPRKIVSAHDNYEFVVDGSTSGWEFRTKNPMKYEGITTFGNHIINQCNKENLQINEKCSAHISISHPALKMPNYTAKKVKNLQAICTALAVPLLFPIMEQRFKDKSNFDQYYKVQVSSDRYTSVSFRKRDDSPNGYFEFRFIGGKLTQEELKEAFDTVAYSLWAALKLLNNKKEYGELIAESHGMVQFLKASLLLPDIGVSFTPKSLIQSTTKSFIEKVKQVCVQ